MPTHLQNATHEESSAGDHAGEPAPNSIRRLVNYTPGGFLTLLGAAGVLAAAGLSPQLWSSQEGGAEITDVVRRGMVSIRVTAGGELQSGNSVDVVCEAEGQQIKIVEMLPEGTEVAQGDVVLKFDTADIRKALAEAQIKVMRAETAVKTAQQELRIQENKGASVIAQATLVLKLAELDLNKYENGDYGVAVNDLQGLIALAKSDLEEAQLTAAAYKKLVKQGFRTPEQLRAKEEAVMRSRYFLTRDQSKLKVLENFTRERQLTELRAKAAEAGRELERAKGSAAALRAKADNDLRAAQAALRLEQENQSQLATQLTHYTIKAPKSGVVVYAEATTEGNRIRPGAAVHFKQKLFSLPDMSKMLVRAYVHESVIGRVQAGLPSEVRIDAYPDLALTAAVKAVSTFYDPEREWMSGGVKEYATFVEIANLPQIGLKPGMTAEVTIHVRDIPDALHVPIQAVAEREGTYVAFVRESGRFAPRDVVVSDSNDRFLVVESGLEEGDEVALDARLRLAAER